jgi:hypothetical protein
LIVINNIILLELILLITIKCFYLTRVNIINNYNAESMWTLLYHGPGCSMYSSSYHLVRVMLSRIEMASLLSLAANSTSFWGFSFSSLACLQNNNTFNNNTFNNNTFNNNTFNNNTFNNNTFNNNTFNNNTFNNYTLVDTATDCLTAVPSQLPSHTLVQLPDETLQVSAPLSYIPHLLILMILIKFYRVIQEIISNLCIQSAYRVVPPMPRHSSMFSSITQTA